MGAFVTLFNYIGYRLMLSPWELSQAVVGLLSVAYLTGTWSSPKAGAMTSRYGRGPVMLFSTAVMLGGLLLTLFTSLWLIFAGMLLFFRRLFRRALRGPVVGLARVRAGRRDRPRHFIFSAIIWGPVLPGR
ncbi:membrane protein [Salmonella sp. NCTC 11881]|nr:membrane protein [Salmonella sp. NCTC 11881]